MMYNNGNIVVLCNDSVYTRVAIKALLDSGLSIGKVYFSKGAIRKRGMAFKALQNSALTYIFYRLFIQISLITPLLKNVFSAKRLLSQNEIEWSEIDDVNSQSFHTDAGAFSIAILVNFDQVIRQKLIDCFNGNVINVHASDLPDGKGISPAVWYFFRGTPSLVFTAYKIHDRLDFGDVILKQSFDFNDACFFSNYLRLCKQAFTALGEHILVYGLNEVTPMRRDPVKGEVFGFPSSKLVSKSRRKFISIIGVYRYLRTKGCA